MADNDSNLLRFLWWPGGDYNQALAEHKMTVHLFGATSSPSCASFVLRKCAEDQSQQFRAEVVQTTEFLCRRLPEVCRYNRGSHNHVPRPHKNLGPWRLSSQQMGEQPP